MVTQPASVNFSALETRLDDLPQAARIALRPADAVRESHLDGQALARGRGLEGLASSFHRPDDVEFERLEFKLAGFDLGKIEHVVEQAQQGFAGLVDHLQPLSLNPRQGVVRHGLGHAQHAVQRGADLVADVGHEIALQLAEGLRLLARRALATGFGVGVAPGEIELGDLGLAGEFALGRRLLAPADGSPHGVDVAHQAGVLSVADHLERPHFGRIGDAGHHAARLCERRGDAAREQQAEEGREQDRRNDGQDDHVMAAGADLGDLHAAGEYRRRLAVHRLAQSGRGRCRIPYGEGRAGCGRRIPGVGVDEARREIHKAHGALVHSPVAVGRRRVDQGGGLQPRIAQGVEVAAQGFLELDAYSFDGPVLMGGEKAGGHVRGQDDASHRGELTCDGHPVDQAVRGARRRHAVQRRRAPDHVVEHHRPHMHGDQRHQDDGGDEVKLANLDALFTGQPDQGRNGYEAEQRHLVAAAPGLQQAEQGLQHQQRAEGGVDEPRQARLPLRPDVGQPAPAADQQRQARRRQEQQQQSKLAMSRQHPLAVFQRLKAVEH
jgi:hypothetical protein